MPETTAEKNDKENHERYMKAFSFMGTFTAVVCVIILAASLLYKRAKSYGGDGSEKPPYLEAVYKIIGSGTDINRKNWIMFLVFLVLFGWFVTTSLYILTTRVMVDVFQSTPTLEKIKFYGVYPALFVIGIVLILGVVMFSPWFPLHAFSDASQDKSEFESEQYRATLVYKTASKLGMEGTYKTIVTNISNFFRFLSFIGLGGVIIAAVALMVSVIIFASTNYTGGIVGAFKILLLIVAFLIAVTSVLAAYNAISKKDEAYDAKKNTNITLFILKILKYIPCFILDMVEIIKREFNMTTKPVWILLGVEVVVVGLYFLVPLISQALAYDESKTVLPNIADLRRMKDLGTLENAGIVRTSECSHKTKRKYDYAFSAWMFFIPHPPNVMKNGSGFAPVLDVNGIPTLLYKSTTNELQFRLNVYKPATDASSSTSSSSSSSASASASASSSSSAIYDPSQEQEEKQEQQMIYDDEVDPDLLNTPQKVLPPLPSAPNPVALPTVRSVIVYTIQNVPLQRWNHVFYNYDGANIDIFLNNELLVTLTDYVPAIEHGTIKAGGGGVIGNIANVVFFNHHVTKDAITGIYNSHKDADVPV
jgi:hypothetical protein